MTSMSWQPHLGLDEIGGDLFDLIDDEPMNEATASPRQPRKPSHASRSIDRMAKDAIQHGRYSSLTALLDDVGGMTQYRLFNAFLALLQRPGSRYLLPAHRWEDEYRRLIRPNESPIVLLVPHGPLMFLYDVSQTEATPASRPLSNEFRNPFAMQDAHDAGEKLALLVDNVKGDGVRLLPAGRGLGKAGCIWTYDGGVSQAVAYRNGSRAQVRVRYESLYNANYSSTEQLATVAHELGHLYCGHIGGHNPEWWVRRRLSEDVMEMEAESVARIVFRRFFPGVDLPAYRRLPAGTALPDLTEVSLSHVMRAASWIEVDLMERRAGPRRGTRSAPAPHPVARATVRRSDKD